MNFKKFIKNNKDARKIFGRKEIDIILKQLDGIDLTQSEKNRLSQDIRPKLRFMKEISQFKDDFGLKKGANVKNIVDDAVELILLDELSRDVSAIFLFGSHSKGMVTKRSDIDICVLFSREISLKEAMKFRLRIMRHLPEKVDLQVFNNLPQKIKRDIARNHKVLFKKEEFDNLNFTINYLKDEDYFIRMKKIFGESA